MKRFAVSSFGFSLIELIIVISLLGILLTIASVNLFNPLSKNKVSMVAGDVTSILREAQYKSINSTDSENGGSSEFGVHFENNSYTLFKGLVYNSSSNSNFEVKTVSNISIEKSLPCSSQENCNNIIFEKYSGEVHEFDENQNSICIQTESSDQERMIKINSLGVVAITNECI